MTTAVLILGFTIYNFVIIDFFPVSLKFDSVKKNCFCVPKTLLSHFATGEYLVGCSHTFHEPGVLTGVTFMWWRWFSFPLTGAEASPFFHKILDTFLFFFRKIIKTKKCFGSPALFFFFFFFFFFFAKYGEAWTPCACYIARSLPGMVWDQEGFRCAG